MTLRITKRISITAGVVWLCLILFLATVELYGLTIAGVRREAFMLIFMMNAPFLLGFTGLVVAGSGIAENVIAWRGRRAGAN